MIAITLVTTRLCMYCVIAITLVATRFVYFVHVLLFLCMLVPAITLAAGRYLIVLLLVCQFIIYFSVTNALAAG